MQSPLFPSSQITLGWLIRKLWRGFIDSSHCGCCLVALRKNWSCMLMQIEVWMKIDMPFGLCILDWWWGCFWVWRGRRLYFCWQPRASTWLQPISWRRLSGSGFSLGRSSVLSVVQLPYFWTTDLPFSLPKTANTMLIWSTLMSISTLFDESLRMEKSDSSIVLLERWWLMHLPKPCLPPRSNTLLPSLVFTMFEMCWSEK